jgi:uncharacterized membrane protein
MEIEEDAAPKSITEQLIMEILKDAAPKKLQKMEDRIRSFVLGVAVEVHGIRKFVKEYFNGELVMDLYPQTITQPGTLQKVGYDVEKNRKTFHINLIEGKDTTHAIDFLQKRLANILKISNNVELRYNLVEVESTTIPSRSKFVILKTPRGIGFSDNSSEVITSASCLSRTSKSSKTGSVSSKSKSSLQINDFEERLRRKDEKLYLEHKLIISSMEMKIKDMEMEMKMKIKDMEMKMEMKNKDMEMKIKILENELIVKEMQYKLQLQELKKNNK